MYYNYRTHCSHPQHVLVRCQYSSSSGHVCDLCAAGFRGLVGLRCKACDFDIHEACADYFQPAISSFAAHPWHGLALGRVADNDRVCDLCAAACPRGGFVYRCVPCGFDVHPLCTMFPAKVRSPLHPEHELAMVPAAAAAAANPGAPLRNWFGLRQSLLAAGSTGAKLAEFSFKAQLPQWRPAPSRIPGVGSQGTGRRWRRQQPERRRRRPEHRREAEPEFPCWEVASQGCGSRRRRCGDERAGIGGAR
ncbi:hypothetical protein OsJ_25072 [Oryza sativa Japonica Group]|uniref:Phorbol-ester/DAG-type domain-containing protein n=1 Tax=Oryza sativa subsp. japonica TaxID=39947 RepID=A3BM21_ORYSJ|nr:hypothetical protein OsJ_25072 [Oryza sativa Japonica Group]